MSLILLPGNRSKSPFAGLYHYEKLTLGFVEVKPDGSQERHIVLSRCDRDLGDASLSADFLKQLKPKDVPDIIFRAESLELAMAWLRQLQDVVVECSVHKWRFEVCQDPFVGQFAMDALDDPDDYDAASHEELLQLLDSWMVVQDLELIDGIPPEFHEAMNLLTYLPISVVLIEP